METPYEIRRSRRKTVAITVTGDARVLVRAPLRLPQREIDGFVQKHIAWIEKHLALQRERIQNAEHNRLDETDERALRETAAQVLPERVAYYAGVMHVSPAGIRVTGAKRRWGSCSSQNRLCFSYRTALLPPEALDYIVVHELAHIREKNHGPRFYAEVAAILPDYRERVALVRQTEAQLGE